MKAKLHKRSIELADEGFTWDTELKGFGLKVTNKGKRVFVVQKRPHKGAKTLKRYTIGAYPSVSPEEARTQAKAILGRITLGLPTSPVLSQSGASFREEIERFYRDHVLAKLRSTTQKDMRYMIDKHLLPEFGKLTLDEVTPSVVRSFHSRLGSKHPYRANRVLALLSKFFSTHDPHGPNPCRGIEKFREHRRQPPQSLQLESLLDPSVPTIIRVLLLTGMRKGEALSLRWEWIHWSEGTIHLPDSKTGQKIVYLSSVVLELLRDLPQHQEGLVFPSPNLRRNWEKIRPPGARLHDLRHHYASTAANDLSLPLVAGLLGHKDIKTTMRYVHNKDLKSAASFVGERMNQFKKGVSRG